MLQPPPPPKVEVHTSKGEARDNLAALGVVDPEQMKDAKAIWNVFALAVNQARRPVRPDRKTEAGEWGGNYRAATKALDWIMAADGAASWLMQVGADPIVPNVLEKIRYRDIFAAIKAAAEDSEKGRKWVETSDEFRRLAELVRQTNMYFKGEESAPVVSVK